MTIAHVATGTKSSGSTGTTLAIARPGSGAAGQLTIVGRVGWNDTITFTDESGWTSGSSLAGGTGTSVDAHTSEVRVDYQELVGGESTPITFDAGGTISGWLGNMISYSKSNGNRWDVAVAFGTDDTHGSNRSITASTSVSFVAGDFLVCVVAYDTDQFAATPTYTLTASGITFGSTTRRTTDGGVTSGNDGNIQICDASVSSGSGTVAPALSITQVTNQCGPAAFVRLHEIVVVSGAGLASLGGTFTASGTPEVFGQAVAAFGGTFTASGGVFVNTVTGAGQADFGGTFTALGIDRAIGQATASLGGTFTALGIDTALGQAGADLGGTFTALGIDRALGGASALFGGSFIGVGSKSVKGVILTDFGGTFAGLGQAITPGLMGSLYGAVPIAPGMLAPLDEAAFVGASTATTTQIGSATPKAQAQLVGQLN